MGRNFEEIIWKLKVKARSSPRFQTIIEFQVKNNKNFEINRKKGQTSMNISIRKMIETDRECIAEMMRIFYHSPAVWTNGSEEIYQNDITACVSNSPYAEGFVFENEKETVGYGMIAKSFSTEFGKPCIWIEDLYLKEKYRGKGIGSSFFQYLEKEYPNTIMRLEVEEENVTAVAAYRKNGYEELPYMEMKKEV